jgi:hypothetical protein
MQLTDTHKLELGNALTGFYVATPDGEHLGEVVGTNHDRTCLIVARRRRLGGLRRRRPIHRSRINDIDLDTMTITVRPE